MNVLQVLCLRLKQFCASKITAPEVEPESGPLNLTEIDEEDWHVLLGLKWSPHLKVAVQFMFENRRRLVRRSEINEAIDRVYPVNYQLLRNNVNATLKKAGLNFVFMTFQITDEPVCKFMKST